MTCNNDASNKKPVTSVAGSLELTIYMLSMFKDYGLESLCNALSADLC